MNAYVESFYSIIERDLFSKVIDSIFKGESRIYINPRAVKLILWFLMKILHRERGLTSHQFRYKLIIATENYKVNQHTNQHNN